MSIHHTSTCGRCQHRQRIWGASSSVCGSGHTTDQPVRGAGLDDVSVVPIHFSVPSLTRCQGNEEHKDRALGIAVADCRRHRRKPFVGIALYWLSVCRAYSITEYTDIELILDNLVVVKPSGSV
jgi:hypothetical protein